MAHICKVGYIVDGVSQLVRENIEGLVSKAQGLYILLLHMNLEDYQQCSKRTLLCTSDDSTKVKGVTDCRRGL